MGSFFFMCNHKFIHVYYNQATNNSWWKCKYCGLLKDESVKEIKEDEQQKDTVQVLFEGKTK